MANGDFYKNKNLNRNTIKARVYLYALIGKVPATEYRLLKLFIFLRFYHCLQLIP